MVKWNKAAAAHHVFPVAFGLDFFTVRFQHMLSSCEYVATPAHVLEYLLGAQFPCTRKELIHAAENNIPPMEIVETLEMLPDVSYDRVEDLIDVLKRLCR